MKGRVSGGGGCCFGSYNSTNTTPTNPYYNYINEVSNVDRIMLRFRPIAPKPTISGLNSSSSSGGSSNDTILKPNVVGKRRRKPINTTTSRRKKSRSQNVRGPCNPMASPPLLPRTPQLSPNNNNNSNGGPTWACNGPAEVVQSSVTVEGVSDTWQDGNGLGRTDEERKRRLEEDTCPGFITDGWNRVWWTNEEYRKMVGGEEDTWRKVKLEMREGVELPKGELFAAFTCRARVQYGTHTLTLPCDVWRMNHGGGFAWRLDVPAALCLAL